MAAEGAFNLHSSSARAQKAPPPAEHENLCLFVTAGMQREHWTGTLIEQKSICL